LAKTTPLALSNSAAVAPVLIYEFSEPYGRKELVALRPFFGLYAPDPVWPQRDDSPLVHPRGCFSA
jgi:hypothetical protein